MDVLAGFSRFSKSLQVHVAGSLSVRTQYEPAAGLRRHDPEARLTLLDAA